MKTPNPTPGKKRATSQAGYASTFSGAANAAMVKAKVPGARGVTKKTPGSAKEGGMPSKLTQALKIFHDYAKTSKGGNTAAGYKKNLDRLTSGMARNAAAGALSSVNNKAKVKTSNQGDYNAVNTRAAAQAMKKAGVKNPSYMSGDTRRNPKGRK